MTRARPSRIRLGTATVPVNRTVIAIACEHYSGDRQRGAIATLSVAVAAGTGLGFPVTSLIADAFGVATALWAGTVSCAAALLGVRLCVPRAGGSTTPVRLDLPGAMLLGLGLGALLLAVSKGASWHWGSTRTLALAAVAVVVLGAWAAFEQRSADPLVDLRLLSQRALIGANALAPFSVVGEGKV